MVKPYFLLESFLKSLLSYIWKEFATSRVFLEEQVIFRAQHLELIYSQSGMLYKIIPDVSRSTLDLEKLKATLHVDGIVGFSQSKVIDLLTNQMQNLAIQLHVVGPAPSSLPLPPSHRVYILCT